MTTPNPRPRRLAWVLLALLACPMGGIRAQSPGELGYEDRPELPPGIPGQRIRALVDAFNAGDPDAIRSFIEEQTTPSFQAFAPMEGHVEAWRGALRRWGPVTIHGTRAYDPPRPETVVIVRDAPFEGWHALVVSFDATDGNRVATLSFNDARPPTDVEIERLAPAALPTEIGRFVETACERDVFSGTVLVARGDERVYAHACGEASKRFHVANDLDTRFNLGSMNKMFTSVATMQLVERGLVSLDDTISKWVDETWLPRTITDRVTVRHLLTHTSGLGSYFNRTFMESSRAGFRALEDYKPLLAEEHLAFEPGSDWQYSNTGMFLLGVVVEQATGVDYFDYIRTHIYEPAGMTRSDSYEMDQPVENLAIGYERDPTSAQGFRNNLYEHVIKGGPAGGGFSTVGDLERFAHALLDGTLLPRERLDEMWTDFASSNYGYGFGVRSGPDGKVVGHSGGFPGISSNLDIYVDEGWIVAVMSNYGSAAGMISNGIAERIARTETEAS